MCEVRNVSLPDDLENVKVQFDLFKTMSHFFYKYLLVFALVDFIQCTVDM